MFNPDADAALRPILVGGTSFRWIIIDLTSSRELNVSLNNHSLTYGTGQIIQPGTWYNVTASLDVNAGILRLFLNGQNVLTQTLPKGFTQEVITSGTQTDKHITLENYSNRTASKGLIRNLRIYNRALP